MNPANKSTGVEPLLNYKFSSPSRLVCSTLLLQDFSQEQCGSLRLRNGMKRLVAMPPRQALVQAPTTSTRVFGTSMYVLTIPFIYIT